MDSRLKDNIRDLMYLHNMTPADLSEQSGVTASTIKRLKTDANSNPTITSLIPIARAFGVTISQLVGLSALPEPNSPRQCGKQREIPIVDWSDVALWPTPIANQPVKFLSTDVPLNIDSFALIVRNDSFGYFTVGSILIINYGQEPDLNDYFLVANKKNNQASLFQYIAHDGVDYLKAIIRDIPSKVWDKSVYTTVGKVVQIRMNL